jgi:hypothetical protein
MTIEHTLPGTVTFVEVPTGEAFEIMVEGKMRRYYSGKKGEGARLLGGGRASLGETPMGELNYGTKAIKPGVTFVADGVVVRIK